jgi:hypothetical protein
MRHTFKKILQVCYSRKKKVERKKTKTCRVGPTRVGATSEKLRKWKQKSRKQCGPVLGHRSENIREFLGDRKPAVFLTPYYNPYITLYQG